MAKMNWDRIRTETRVRDHGSKFIDGLAPVFYEKKKKRTSAKGKLGSTSQASRSSKEMRACPHCPAIVRIDRLAAHISRLHGTPEAVQGKTQSIQSTVQSKSVSPCDASKSILLDQLRSEIEQYRDQIEWHRLLEAIVRSFDPLAESRGWRINRVIANKVTNLIRQSLISTTPLSALQLIKPDSIIAEAIDPDQTELKDCQNSSCPERKGAKP
jgi:hypothetical protein